MEQTQFNYEIERLRDRYGKAKYPQVLADMLFMKFRKVEYSAFRRAVSKLITHEQYAPLYPSFATELLPELERLKKQEVHDLTEGHECHRCRNTGRISVQLNPNEANYSFQCDCKLGEQMFPNFPKYKPRR